MELKEFKEKFKKELDFNNIKISEDNYEDYYFYMKEIINWNDKINLTAITDEKEFLVKHLIDSLTINSLLEDKNTLIDIGTGAGFPGIPLKIANQKLNVTLIDSVNKKLNVIRDISDKMNLEGIKIIHTRAEDLAMNTKYREKYDIATTRAVSRINTIVEYMLPFIKVGGKAICMKGPNIDEELDEAKHAIEILGGKVESVKNIVIDNEYERNIVIIRKEKNTPKQYPRGKGKPLKEPIK